MRKGEIYKIFGISLVLVMIASMLGGLPVSVREAEASPETIHVPDDYASIQAAVDAASLGDIIIVYPGTYIENVDVNKAHLTIQSENGADTTVVQAANSDDHYNISGRETIGPTDHAGVETPTLPDGQIRGAMV